MRGLGMTIIATSLLVAACATTDADADADMGAAAMPSESDAAKIAVVEDMIDAWNTKDWDRVVDLFAEDGVLHSMMVDPIVGRESIDVRIKHMAEGIDAIELQPRHIGVIDGTVFIERVDSFTYNGHPGSVPVVGVIEIGADGKIKEWREYYDRAELLAAMGVVQDFDSEAR